MADKIYMDTELLRRLSGQLNQLSRSLSAVQGDITGSVSEIRRVASGQDKLIRMAIRVGQNTETTVDGIRRLSRAVQRASDIWSEAESKLANQNFVVMGIPQQAGDGADAQRKERQEQAKWFKIGLTGLCIIGSIVVVVATGGAALPVIAAGVATGAVSAAGYNAADQYAEKGWDNIDWSDVGKDAVIGGVVGGITSGISVGGGAAAYQVTSSITKSAATATGRLVTHTAGGAVTAVITGTAGRATGEAVSEYMRDGTVNWDRVRDRAFDPRSMLIDGTIGATTGYVQGRNYNHHLDQVRKESYLQRNPYQKDYGNIDWAGHVGDGMDHSKPIDYHYEIPADTYVRRTGPETGNYLRGLDDSFESASLPYNYTPEAEHLYRVDIPIPETTRSIVQPGFDMPGGGTQFETDLSIGEMVEQGYLVRIY